MRGYVLAVWVILGILGAGGVAFGVVQGDLKAKQDVRATELALIPSLPEPTRTLGPTPSAGFTPTAEPCPVDYRQWTYVKPDPYYSGNLLKIEPHCVYEGLEKTVAWVLMAETMGYSGNEAAELLGFPEMPYAPVERMKISTDKASRLDMQMSAPFILPDSRFWILNASGKPAVTMSIRGCYEAFNIEKMEVKIWGEYPVVCKVALDVEQIPKGWVVIEHDLEGQFVTLSKVDNRRLIGVFGYSGEGKWTFIGVQREPVLDLSDKSIDYETDRQNRSQSYDLVIWDSVWVETAYGHVVIDLPAQWEDISIQNDVVSKINNDMVSYLKERFEFGGNNNP
jgi:hypothetical protein